MATPDPYAPHRAFVAPARDGGPLWQVGAGLALSELAFWGSPLLLYPVFGEATEAVLEGRAPLTLFLSLILYAVPALVLIQWVRGCHGRSGWSLFGPPRTAWRELWRTGLAVGLALVVLELILPTYAMNEILEVRALPVWLLALPMALLSVVVQSGSEELIFRGYLQQQLGALSQRRLVWMVLPSALFGLLHYWNALGSGEGLLYVAWAFMLGLACADLTARTGSIGAAVGLHSANNLLIFGLYGMQNGPDSGFALFLYPHAEPAPGPGLGELPVPFLLYDIAISAAYILVLWLAARVAVRR